MDLDGGKGGVKRGKGRRREEGEGNEADGKEGSREKTGARGAMMVARGRTGAWGAIMVESARGAIGEK